MMDFNEFNLYLIRHGQSAVNALPDQIGQAPNTPLTKLGESQSLSLYYRLDSAHFDRIYSSDYLRALTTAQLVFPQDQDRIITTPALREYSAGDWVGASRQQVMTPPVMMKMGYMNNSFLPPGGESMHQVERRASQWLEETILYNKEVCAEAWARKGRKGARFNFAVFSHGMTIKCLLHYVMGFDRNFTWRIELENTSITKLSFDDKGWKLIMINDHAHLL